MNVLSSSLWFGAMIWRFVSSFIWYLLQKSEVPADYDKHDPEQKQIYRFVRTLFSAAQLTAECAIVTLVRMLSSFDWCPKLAVVFLPLIERPISTCMHDTTQLLSSRSRRDQPGLRVESSVDTRRKCCFWVPRFCPLLLCAAFFPSVQLARLHS